MGRFFWHNSVTTGFSIHDIKLGPVSIRIPLFLAIKFYFSRFNLIIGRGGGHRFSDIVNLHGEQ